MSRQKKVDFSSFYCTNCGNQVYSLPRLCSKLREPGHLKNLYCIYCKEEHNCVEVRQFGKYTYEHFKFEKEHNNFTETGQRIVPYEKLLKEKQNE